MIRSIPFYSVEPDIILPRSHRSTHYYDEPEQARGERQGAAKKDYMINLKSELEIRTLHEKIDHQIMNQQAEIAGDPEGQIEIMNDILQRI
jgi:hypothetical protein